MSDLDQIIGIWKQGLPEQATSISGSQQTLNENEVTAFFSERIQQQQLEFVLWVCLSPSNQIVGWQAITPFYNSPLPLVRGEFAQSSTYVHRDHHRKGIGKCLLQHAIQFCQQKTKLHYIVGLVLHSNQKSIVMCEKLGFYTMGHLPARKINQSAKWCLLVYEL